MLFSYKSVHKYKISLKKKKLKIAIFESKMRSNYLP